MQAWNECASRLVDVAAGRAPADTLIRNGRWVNVHSGEILPGTDFAIVCGRFAAVGPDLSRTVGDNTRIVEAEGRYVLPGLCDAHMHVESGMVTVTEFARAVIPHGTTSLFIDPHEIGNVLGLDGVRLMHGEMMNFPGVAAADATMLGEIAATQHAGKTVGGHYASPDLGAPFQAYVAGGPADDHEGTRAEDAIARVRQGMRAMLRLGSAWYDVAEQIKAVTESGLDPRNFILCTDDSHSGTLVNDGHMNRVVRHAIAQGVKPITAIQMATLNTAQHFGLERELGSLTPGRRADAVITSDLPSLPVELVMSRGEVVAEHGGISVDLPVFTYPSTARNTVNLGRDVVPTDFDTAAPAGADQVPVRVIGVIENQAPTRALEATVPVVEGCIAGDATQDICHIALVERHRGTGKVQNALVSGFGYNVDCAVASTVAHDCHHLLVVGTNKADMAQAANRLAEVGGGVIVVAGGEEVALVELPIAGLMSDERSDVVAAKAQQLVQAMADCGCTLNNAYMQHSLLALVVIPELRLSDQGLVDVREFAPVDLVISA